MSALVKGIAKLKLSADDLWETYMDEEQRKCIRDIWVGEMKLKLPNNAKKHMRKATMSSNIIPVHLNPRICKNRTCRMLLLGVEHKSCSKCSKQPLQALIKLFRIENIVSKKLSLAKLEWHGQTNTPTPTG